MEFLHINYGNYDKKVVNISNKLLILSLYSPYNFNAEKTNRQTLAALAKFDVD